MTAGKGASWLASLPRLSNRVRMTAMVALTTIYLTVCVKFVVGLTYDDERPRHIPGTGFDNTNDDEGDDAP